MISPWLISELVSSVESIKFPKLRKNWEFWEISRKISKKNRNLLALVQMFAVSTLSVSTHLFVLKNRTSKNGTPETLDHPLKLKYFEFKNFGENGINFLMDILWIQKDFGYHNVTWKRRFNSEIFGFLKWCNDDWLEESYEVNLRSDYR